MISNKYMLEVCCGSVDDAIEAEKGGAGRVELNSNIMYGGLTPTIGSIIRSKKKLHVPVMVMIRPRGGGFCYTDEEMAAMEYDTQYAIDNGADGIVFGILNSNGTIDEARCERIIKLCKGVDIVFHRAIDVVPDPFKALDTLINLGVKRVLTTGQENTPEDGLELIVEMAKYVGEKLEIMPGGCRPNNVVEVLEAIGCYQAHMAAFVTRYDSSTLNRAHVYYGMSIFPPEDRYDLTNKVIVESVRKKMNILG